jgi:aminopeptidase
MKDPRIDKLSNLLIKYSTSIQPGENLLIELSDIPEEMAASLIETASAAGANVMVNTYNRRVVRTCLKSATDASFQLEADRDIELMKKMQAYIAIRGGSNANEYSDVPSDRMASYYRIDRPVADQRVNHTKWCVLRWPSPSMAQMAGMSTDQFEDFYFQVCTIDYDKMATAVVNLKNLMEKTDQVHIKHDNGTDLTFSIKGIPAIPCVGTMNIPDGECFTAPVKDSVNGTIIYNSPTMNDGKRFENIRLVIQNGKIVEATSSDTESLNSILDRDEGARFFGEFAIGFNPYITKPMCDILFDEKIAGSFHLTPGNAYDEAPNGNKSTVHWDLVQIQSPEYGGGEIWFDGVLIRKDGRFVVEELFALNPENLK